MVRRKETVLWAEGNICQEPDARGGGVCSAVKPVTRLRRNSQVAKVSGLQLKGNGTTEGL